MTAVNPLLDYEYFMSDSDMDIDISSEVEQTERRPTDQEIQDREKRSRRNRRRHRVRFMTNRDTQTESLTMLGHSVCITGPAVDQYWHSQRQVDEYRTVVRRLTRQIEASQKRIAQLEKEAVEKQIEVVSAQMQTFTLQTAASFNEKIIAEFAEKIRLTTDLLETERLDRKTDEDAETCSVE